MSSYPTGLTLISQLDATIPADTEANNKWPEAERQLRDSVKRYLLKAHADDGSITIAAVKAGCYAPGSIHTADIANDVLGNAFNAFAVSSTTISAMLSAVSIGTANLVGNATDPAHLATGCVTWEKIAANTVSATCMAVNSITTTSICDNAVIASKLGPLAVTTEKVAENAIKPAQMWPGAGTTISTVAAPLIPVPIYQTTPPSNQSALCSIGGALTATIVPGGDGAAPVLTFALVGSAGSSGMFGRIYKDVSGPVLAGYNYTEFHNGDMIGSAFYTQVNATTPSVNYCGLKFLVAGTYYIRYKVCGYSLGTFQALICTNTVAYGSAPAIAVGGYGTNCTAPLGTGLVSDAAIVRTVAKDDILYFGLWSEYANATNGFGVDAAANPKDMFALVDIIPLG